ncbi:MAG: hypothetical protein JNM09_03560 [Blastocatellia bacterium]|nr:hypothetical protein [Blastocatellia bacterium]
MTLLVQLNSLEATGLIRLSAVLPELEYLFRHALVQDAAYGSLLKTDRRHLHQSVGQALEQLYPERLAEIASTLALHFEKADHHDKAILYFTLAGDRARASYANNEAIQFYQSALTHIEAVGNRDEQRCQLYESLGDLVNLIGQRETARQYFMQAIAALAVPLGQARLYRKIAKSLVDDRSYVEAEQSFDKGEAILQRSPSNASEWHQESIQNQLDRVWLYYLQGQPDQVEKIVQKLEPWIEANGSNPQKAQFYTGQTQGSLQRRRYEITPAQLALSHKGLEAARASDDPNLLAEMHFGYGFHLLWYGSWSEAETELEAAMALSKKTGNTVNFVRAFTYLILLHRVRKDIPKLQELLPEWLRTLNAAGAKEYLPYMIAINAWLALQANRMDEAGKLAQEALVEWESLQGANPFKWLARWILLYLAFQQNDFSAAIEQAKAMLLPSQQKLPEDVTAALEAVVTAGETGQPDTAQQPLVEVLRLATEKSYL